MRYGRVNRKQRRMEQKLHKSSVPAASAAVQSTFAAAVQLHHAGKHIEAEQLCRQILANHSRHADSLHLLGVIAHHTQRGELALELIGKAIAINAAEASYHGNLGTALWQLGRLDDAAASYRTALRLRPGYANAHFNLGTVLYRQRSLDAAEASLRQAVVINPDYAEAHNNLGNVLREQGRTDEAASCYRKAVSLKPDYAEAHNNLGLVSGQDEAIGCFHKAVACNPDYLEAHFNLATAHLEQGRPEQAASGYRRALVLKPDYPDALDNLGTALKQLQRLPEAAACYRAALELEPDHAGAHANLSMILLAQGDWAAGWQEYEWRWKVPQMYGAARSFSQPQWRGESAIGRTLLIHAEQGFGDTLQFCRYAPLAAKRGLRVIIQVQKPLVRLLESLADIDQIVPQDADLPAFDLHCPLLSMPLALDTTVATIPGDGPYLHADAGQAAMWHARLADADAGPRIGLVWAGNSYRQAPALAAVDRRRSLPAEQLAPLLDLPGLHFISLQKDASIALPLTDLMHEMHDFADTAALVAALDLVISVDTAVAHLAGALGKPVWLLDRFDSCWRWLNGRHDSPWYPRLRIYRQPRPGDWDAVIAGVVRDLQTFNASKVMDPAARLAA